MEQKLSRLVQCEKIGRKIRPFLLYRKDPASFDGVENYEFAKRKIHAARYNDLDKKSLIAELKRKDSRIEYLESVIVSKDYQIKTMEKKS